MEKEVALSKRREDVFASFDDLQLGKTLGEHLFHAVAHTRRPKPDFGIGKELLQEMENSGGVSDIADIDGLPGRPEDDPKRFALLLRAGDGGEEGGRKGRGAELAAGNHRRILDMGKATRPVVPETNSGPRQRIPAPLFPKIWLGNITYLTYITRQK